MTWTTRELNEIQRAFAHEFMGEAAVLGVRIRRASDGQPVLSVTCVDDVGGLTAKLPTTYRGLGVVVQEAQPMVLAYAVAR